MVRGGRPLEMEVAATLMQTTSTVEQSPYYADPETGKPREIDVVGLYPISDWQYVVSIEVECKAKAPPFIVLLPAKADPLRQRCASSHGRTLLPTPTESVVID